MPIIAPLLLLLFLLYAGLMIYLRDKWDRSPLVEPGPAVGRTLKITVVVPARNEEKYLPACLASLVAQDYPGNSFEVIVVDDHSTDRTPEIIRQFGYSHANIKSLRVDEAVAGPVASPKKRAISLGIEKASGEIIVTTDADCICPPEWLSTIASAYNDDSVRCLVMPVSVLEETNEGMMKKFLHLFQSLDVLSLQAVTGAAVHGQLLGMCNGANFSYRKSTFEEVGGFSGIDDLASGDDMLLLQKIMHRFRGSARYVKSRGVIVRTHAEPNLRAFLQQRIRWASKSTRYSDRKVLPVLAIVYLFNLFLLIGFLAGLSDKSPFEFVSIGMNLLSFSLLMMMMKTLLELWFLYPVAKFFGQQRSLAWFPLMQPFHVIYSCLAGLLGLSGQYEWKDRKLR